MIFSESHETVITRMSLNFLPHPSGEISVGTLPASSINRQQGDSTCDRLEVENPAISKGFRPVYWIRIRIPWYRL